jgi:NADH:ubiquinone oxidoreductase subunit F (NADH-binding)
VTAVLDEAVAGRAHRRPWALGWIGSPRLLRGVGDHDLTTYADHVAEHGARPNVTGEQVLAQLDAVALAGRGGAGFPLASKLRALHVGREVEQPVVVVNGCEGEPGSGKDVALLSRTPHLVLDGAATVAEAVGAKRVLIAVTAPNVAALLAVAVSGRPDEARFELRELPRRFIAGEARALISGLNGGPGTPPGRRVLPTTAGVGGAPTLLANAETFAQLAYLLRVGPAEFATVGTSAEAGTTLVTVSGAVRRAGVLEVPFGTRLSAVAEAAGAVDSAGVSGIIVGGYHGGWISSATLRGLDWQLPISRAGLARIGGTIGAGAVMFVSTDTCGLGELTRVASWLADQSAKNCGPCTFGLPALVADLTALGRGSAGPDALARHAPMVTGRGACSHPDGAVRFIASGLTALAEEVAQHQSQGGCGRPVRGELPL